jgi:hypothetical protein
MTLTEHLTPVLKKLRLSGILDTLELRLNQAIDGNLDYAEFLFRILHDETERREGKQLSLRIRRAGFEHERTLETFDFAFNPQIPRAKIIGTGSGRLGALVALVVALMGTRLGGLVRAASREHADAIRDHRRGDDPSTTVSSRAACARPAGRGDSDRATRSVLPRRRRRVSRSPRSPSGGNRLRG